MIIKSILHGVLLLFSFKGVLFILMIGTLYMMVNLTLNKINAKSEFKNNPSFMTSILSNMILKLVFVIITLLFMPFFFQGEGFASLDSLRSISSRTVLIVLFLFVATFIPFVGSIIKSNLSLSFLIYAIVIVKFIPIDFINENNGVSLIKSQLPNFWLLLLFILISFVVFFILNFIIIETLTKVGVIEEEMSEAKATYIGSYFGVIPTLLFLGMVGFYTINQ